MTGWLRRAVPALGLLLAPATAAPLPVPRPLPDAGPHSGDVPLPVPRPEEAGPNLPVGPNLPAGSGREAFGPPPPRPAGAGHEALGPPLPPRPADPLAPPEPDTRCGPLLSSGKVAARVAAPITGQDGCGIAAPLTLEAILLPDGGRVSLSPPAVMRCDFAERFADWLRDDVAPATSAAGSLVGLDDAAAYACRRRNWQADGRLSEHARGNAIDLVAFRFARTVVGLKGLGDAAILATLRATACARFSTVLGPGADGWHETDLHLDLQRRRNGYKLCQWNPP